MEKRVYFDKFRGYFWPSPEELRPYFIASKGEEWFYASGNDSVRLFIDGIEGTENEPDENDRANVDLSMWGNPDQGVLLIYDKWIDRQHHVWSSKGDMSRIREWVRASHATLLPIGLFIPFADAWKAVEEFMVTDGAHLPKSIEWVENNTLPKWSFPEPHDPKFDDVQGYRVPDNHPHANSKIP